MTDIGMSGYLTKDHMIAEQSAEIGRLRAALEEEWKQNHWEKCGHDDCVSFGGSKLCHHERPAPIAANEQRAESNTMRQARLAAEEVATWSPERQAHAKKVVNQGGYGQTPAPKDGNP